MHLVWKRMEKLIEELLNEESISVDERFNAIVLAMNAYRLPHDEAQIEAMRKHWKQAVAAGRKASQNLSFALFVPFPASASRLFEASVLSHLQLEMPATLFSSSFFVCLALLLGLP